MATSAREKKSYSLVTGTWSDNATSCWGTFLSWLPEAIHYFLRGFLPRAFQVVPRPQGCFHGFSAWENFHLNTPVIQLSRLGWEIFFKHPPDFRSKHLFWGKLLYNLVLPGQRMPPPLQEWDSHWAEVYGGSPHTPAQLPKNETNNFNCFLLQPGKNII